MLTACSHHKPNHTLHYVRLVTILGLSTTVLLTSGCNLIGFAAHVIAGGEASKKVRVLAEYRGLENKKIAVLVSTDEYTLFDYPQAPITVCRSVSARLAANIEGVEIVDPRQLDTFQKANPFWITLPYAELAQRLQVDRIVYVELVQYRLHEPGNSYLWKGTIVANVSVAEARSTTTGQFAYSTTVQAQYPDGPVGMLHGDDQTVELGLIQLFAQEVVHRFQDHDAVMQ